MFCRNCGAENNDDSLFCRNCGCRLHEEQKQHSEPVEKSGDGYDAGPEIHPSDASTDPEDKTDEQDREYVAESEPVPEKSRDRRPVYGKLAVLAVCLAVLITVGMMLIHGLNRKVDLNDYLIVEFDGCDGYGTASVEIDWDRLAKENRLKFASRELEKYVPGLGEELEEGLEESVILTYLMKSLRVSVSPADGLYNHDSIELKWDGDAERIRENIKPLLEFHDDRIVVKGLGEAETFDAFEPVTLHYNGVSGNGSATLEYDGDIFSKYDFELSKDSGLKNGDVITVSLEGADIEELVEENGMVPKELKWDYTVSGLDEYVSQLASIDDVSTEKMKKAAYSILSDKIGRWIPDASAENIQCVGDFVQNVEVSRDDTSNYYGVVFLVNMDFLPRYTQVPTKFVNYFDIRFPDVMEAGDDQILYDTTSYVCPEEEFDFNAYYDHYNYTVYSFKGHNSLESLKQDREYAPNGEIYQVEWRLDEARCEEASAPVLSELCVYLCPDSNMRLLSTSEVEAYQRMDTSSFNFPGGRSLIQMIINEIYAMHGYQFKDQEVTDYFNKEAWYQCIPQKSTDMDAIYDSLTDIERENIKLLERYK